MSDVQSFILSMFLDLIRPKSPPKESPIGPHVPFKQLPGFQGPLFHHFTTAVDTQNIKVVFNSVRDTILRKNLELLMLH